MASNDKVRTLVVDDDVRVCRTIKEIFSDHSLECLLAHNCSDALRRAVVDEVDFLIVDQNIEQPKDGLEFLHKIAQLRPDTTRILCTGDTLDDQIESAIDAGVVHQFLQKPVDIRVLVSIVKDHAAEKKVLGAN